MPAVGTVEFEHVTKRYRLGTGGTLRGAVSSLLARDGDARARGDVIHALRDLSFRVEPGESLGLIGPNGAGKTTALKLLSNITRPSSGRVAVHGRVSSLIELGAGFHPELTGRENIFLNGAILGLKRREIARRFDAIVEFSELHRFIDTPVKRYSSGMYVRLGFAVASQLQADILLIDEVLAVGDSAFRQRCLDRMDELKQSGTTILFVSHNMYQVRRLCEQALLLIGGQPRFLGSTEEAVAAYEHSMRSAPDATTGPELGAHCAATSVMIPAVSVLGSSGELAERLRHCESLQVRATYHATCPVKAPIVKVRLVRSDGTVCAMAVSRYRSDLTWTLTGQGEICVSFEPIQLMTGSYSAEVRVIDSADTDVLASGRSPSFYVESPGFVHELDRGYFVPNVSWSHQPLSAQTAESRDGAQN